MGNTVVTVAGGANPSYTFANKPATGVIGVPVYISDVGVNGSLWAWNGTAWVCVSGVAPLMLNGITMGIPSSGLMGNNGALSAITALPFTFSEGLYMYFPANAIAAGVAAGMYWVVMSSTTAGTVYNNTYTGGTPQAPAANTPFVTTGPGAYVQTTGSDITICNVTVQGGLLGANGRLDYQNLSMHNSSAGTKALKFMLDGTTVAGLAGGTTSTAFRFWTQVHNCNSAAIQRIAAIGTALAATPSSSPASTANTQLAINTAVDKVASVTGSLTVATDFIFINSMDIFAYPRA